MSAKQVLYVNQENSCVKSQKYELCQTRKRKRRNLSASIFFQKLMVISSGRLA